MNKRFVKEGRIVKEIVSCPEKIEERTLGSKEACMQELLKKKAEYRNVIEIYEGKLREVNDILTELYKL